MTQPVRVRFAPSPTGPLHIGGVRTALYNYLFARKHGGKFLLRIEDTDQKRYVPGAESYILRTLEWLGLSYDEGPNVGGDFGPYRQSERSALYRKYAEQLVQSGKAYYAFDTPDELDAMRAKLQQAKAASTSYTSAVRLQMKNSLSFSPADTDAWLQSGKPYVIRLKVDPGEEIVFRDLIRDEVRFVTDLLDDKVLIKADGLPTYHLANVVDDHLMQISHVIRGEEWLPSTAHHVLLYRAFGWEATMPVFAHLPLILKPNGKGKLSKRDGVKFDMPVFPLSWDGASPEESFKGFREYGFYPEAVINFLALLGWHPEDDREVFDLSDLVEAFSLRRVQKSGAIFDYEKAKWFNKQYLLRKTPEELARELEPLAAAKNYDVSGDYLKQVAVLMQPRVDFVKDILEDGYYFFEEVKTYDRKAVKKRWKPEKQALLDELADVLEGVDRFLARYIEPAVKAWMEQRELGPGAVFPLVRLALTGSLKGPGVFETMEVLTQYVTVRRLREAGSKLNPIPESVS